MTNFSLLRGIKAKQKRSTQTANVHAHYNNRVQKESSSG